MNEIKIKTGNTFDVKSVVPKSGTYVCVPCGYRQEFKKGDCFPLCFACLEGKKIQRRPLYKRFRLVGTSGQ